jgi:integrase
VATTKWETTVGERGCTVWVGERTLGGNVSVRFRLPGSSRQKTETLGFSVRDVKGRIRKREKRKAKEAAEYCSSELAQGRIPEVPRTRSSPVKAVPHTLGEGVDEYLDIGSGAFATATRHYQDRKRSADDLLSILGRNRPLSEIRPKTDEEVWRHFLKRATRWELHRKAERAVDTLFTIMRWLYAEYPQDIEPVLPRSQWRDGLTRDWTTKFGPKDDPDELRHTEEEAEKLMSNLDHADPRLALLLMVGIELREGQVARSKRTALDMDARGDGWHGKLTVHGAGKKFGEIVLFTPEIRAAFQKALTTGHLRELEAAFQAGEIDDYWLWQNGKMRGSKHPDGPWIPLARHFSNPGPRDIATLVPAFHDFERAVGVTPVENRGFYGLRRLTTDLAADITSDDRALDRLTGHRDPATRTKVYQNRMRQKDRENAAKVRRQMRMTFSGTMAKPDQRKAAISDSEIRQLTKKLFGSELSRSELIEILSE